ncbi:Pol protein, partial [Phytophthora palmivora]
HCQACGIATTASPNAKRRRVVRVSTVAVPDGTDQAGNIGPQAAEAAEESAEDVSCVGTIGRQAGNVVPQTTEASGEDAKGVSGVGNIVPRRVEETEKIESAACVSSVGKAVPHEITRDFLAELMASGVEDMVLLKPETSPEDLNSSSVMDEDLLEGFTKQRVTRLGSEILKNPEDPVCPLVNEYSDVVSKHPPSQLPPDRGVRH